MFLVEQAHWYYEVRSASCCLPVQPPAAVSATCQLLHMGIFSTLDCLFGRSLFLVLQGLCLFVLVCLCGSVQGVPCPFMHR
jgi:hypothetical protein